MGRVSLDVGRYIRMKLPWTKTENYQDSSYTDALVAALIRQVRGRTAGTALTSETGALESAAGLVGRAFMACEVSGDPMYTAALTPQVMELIGRSLLKRGDSVFYLDTSDGLHLLPAQTHSIDGGPMPSSWTYDLSLAGPGELTTMRPVRAEGVAHFRYGCDVETPWRGNAPLGVARAIGDLMAEATTYLTQESGIASRLVSEHSKGWRRLYDLGTDSRREDGSRCNAVRRGHGEQLGGRRPVCRVIGVISTSGHR